MSRFVLWLQLTAVVWHHFEYLPASAGPLAKKEGLYSNEDDVVILNKHNMDGRVYGKSMVWMIEFYNSWCGHCINFAPTWRQFASDLKGWRRVITVGAIDCADDDNLEICREFNIQAYPSIMLLPPKFNRKVSKDKVKLLHTQEKVNMKNVVLEYLTNPEFPVPTTWPRLKPLKSLGDIWEEAKDEHKFVVIVFEDENSIVGRQVVLDLLDYPAILVRTMLKQDVEKFGIIKYPSLYIINRDSSFQHLASGSGLVDSDRHRFVDKLLSMMGLFDSEGRRIKISHADDGVAGHAKGDNNVVEFQQDQNPVIHQVKQSYSTGVHMHDLTSALHYSLRQEVAISSSIEGRRLDALSNFVSVLAKYFPGPAEVTRFLLKLVDYLRNLEGSLTGESWLSAIDNLQDKGAFLPHQVQWVGCRGSLPRYRGYPCAMWTLFHTLTVAAYENKGAVNALEVPLAIRGYMQHFFGCQECSENFLNMTHGIEAEINSPQDAVVWLWAAHNQANRRLHGDVSEDPEHPKIQFPSAEDCPKCRTEQISEPVFLQQWNSSALLLFLVRLYGKESIILDSLSTLEKLQGSRLNVKEELDWWEKKQQLADLKKIRKLRKIQRLNAAERNFETLRDKQMIEQPAEFKEPWNSWGFSHLDLGMCMILYVGSAVLIVVLYYHFIVQKRFRVPCRKYSPYSPV